MEAKGRENPVREKGFGRILPALLGVFILTNGGFGLSVNDIKYSAQPVAAALCYANKQYQNDKGQCEIKWYVSDKNYRKLSSLKYPVRIEVIKDGVDKKGFRWYFYFIEKNGKTEGGGIVKIRDKEIKNFDFSNKHESYSEIKWYVSDKNYRKLSSLKYPVRIEVIKDGVDKKGFRWYFYFIEKNGKTEGGGIVKIRKPVPKNGLYIRANENLDVWKFYRYSNDKLVGERAEAVYSHSEVTPWGEVDIFTISGCSNAYANCDAPDVSLSTIADNILNCPKLKKEFEERGYEMSYAEAMNKLSKYVDEGECSYWACVPGSGGVFCAVEGSDAMDVATCDANGCNY